MVMRPWLVFCASLVLLAPLSTSSSSSPSSEGTFLGCGGYLTPDDSLAMDMPLDTSRVSVGLYSQHGSLKETTDCAPNNGYFFVPIYDYGRYTIRVIAPQGWLIEPKEILVQIDGQRDPCSTGKDLKFVLKGFAIIGSVLNKDSKSGPKRIDIELLDAAGKVVREVQTQEGGAYAFEGVPNGQFEVAVGKASRGSFSFERTSSKVTMKSETAEVAAFVIQGYEIEGRIKDSNENGIKGIKVLLKTHSGQEKDTTETDKDGAFHFPKVTSDDYVVEAIEGNDLKMNPRSQNIQVFDKNIKVSDIRLESFVLRGTVLSFEKGTPLDVSITSTDGKPVVFKGKGQFEIADVQLNQDIGLKVQHKDFIFQDVQLALKDPFMKPLVISPWKYSVSGSVELGNGHFVECASGESGSKVKSRVSESHRFQMFLASGSHNCVVMNADGGTAKGYTPLRRSVEPIDRAIDGVDFILAKLTVSGSVKVLKGTPTAEPARVTIRSPSTGMTDTVKVDSKGQFSFKDLLPGVYAFTVSLDGACWVEETLQREVIDDKTSVVFEQKGFKVTVSSPHSTLLLTDKDEHELQRGSNTICLNAAANKPISLDTKDCKTFEFQPEKLTFPRDNSVVMTLKGINVPIEIEGAEDARAAFEIRVTRNGEKSVLKAPGTKKGVKWQYVFQALEGDDLHIEPVSSEDFFHPPSLNLEVSNDCSSNEIKFSSQAGVFVEGKVEPAVEGAVVSFVNKNYSEISAKTNANGKFRLGPLEESRPGEPLEIYKDNYNFAATDKPGVFTSFRLASVSVKVISEATGEPLANVLVSLSGQDSYRNIAKTGTNGVVEFLSLRQGEYFAKAFLKEWSFSPKNNMLQIEPGKHTDVSFKGTRVAFSAHGSLKYINGKEESGLVVLADSEECDNHREEASTQPDGSFQLSGLRPGCEYRLLSGNPDIQRLITKVQTISVSDQDIKIPGGPIFALRRDEYTDVTIMITSDSLNPNPVDVTIRGDKGYHKVIRVTPNEMAFLSRSIKSGTGEEYTVEVADQRTTFTPMSGYQHVFMKLKKRKSKNEDYSVPNVKFFLPVAIAIFVIVVIRQVYQQKMQKM